MSYDELREVRYRLVFRYRALALEPKWPLAYSVNHPSNMTIVDHLYLHYVVGVVLTLAASSMV